MHLNKKKDLDAISRVGGCMAFIGIARCSWLFQRDEPNEDGTLNQKLYDEPPQEQPDRRIGWRVVL